MTDILPPGHLSTPIEGTVYRDNEQVEAVIKEALGETGVIKRVKVNIREKKATIEVFAHSNKTSGGWRADFELNKYNFTTRDTLEQMKAYVKDTFTLAIRATLNEWLDKGPLENFNKVVMLVVTDLRVEQ